MLKTRTKAIFWIAATFLIGFLLGGGASYFLFLEQVPSQESRSSRPWDRKDTEKEHHSPEEIVERLNRDANLNLSPGQRTQVAEIIRRTREEYDAIAEESRERFSQARHESRDEIRKVLNSQQMSHFDKFLEERKKKREKKAD